MNTYGHTNISGYAVSTFTTENGTQLFIRDAEGIQVYAHRVSGNAMERAREVISELTGETVAPTYDRAAMKKAQSQAIAAAVMTSRDEKTGARAFKALEKAITEIEANDTIDFDGKVLTFVSRHSGNRRFVTRDGCTTLCDCGGNISYHSGLYSIFALYAAITSRKVLDFKPRRTVYCELAAA